MEYHGKYTSHKEMVGSKERVVHLVYSVQLSVNPKHLAPCLCNHKVHLFFLLIKDMGPAAESLLRSTTPSTVATGTKLSRK
jgi:hypothetical protein